MNTPSRSVRRWLAPAALLVALGVTLAWVALPRADATPYATFVRPDGKYRVVVRRAAVFPGLMPGQSGDAPGRVELWDAEGRLLQAKDVEMVQLVERVEWADRNAHIKLVADWQLPD
jgi:hypothetical protein